MMQLIMKLWARYNHINWALFDQMLVSGVNFFTSILLARFLGIAEFGRFTLVWMVILFVASLLFAAVYSPMMSIGPKQQEEGAAEYYGALFLQSLILSCGASVVVFVSFLGMDRFFPEWDVGGLAFPVACAMFSVLLQDFFRRYFFTRERPVLAFNNDSIRYLGQIAILIGLFKIYPVPMDTAKVLWVITATALTATVYGIFYIGGIKTNLNALGQVTRRHWNFSKWYTASAFMQWISENLFILASGAFLGTLAVGALKAAQSLMGVVHILLMGLENIVQIQAAKYFHRDGKKALSDYLKKVSLFGGAATLVIALIAAVTPEFWLGLVFGSDYKEYGFLLQWYAGIFVLIYLVFPLRNGLKAMEQVQPIFKAYLLMAGFSVLAVYPLITLFDLVGVMLGIFGIQVILLATLLMAYIKVNAD